MTGIHRDSALAEDLRMVAITPVCALAPSRLTLIPNWVEEARGAQSYPKDNPSRHCFVYSVEIGI